MTYYIQRRCPQSGLETVDQFDSRKEARAMLAQYSMSDPVAEHYISSRACRAWRESSAAPTRQLTWQAEHTDTFGGEANYSWVRRETFQLPESATDRQIVTAAKAALGLTGCRCRTTPLGGTEGFELRPSGCCQVVFVTLEGY